MARKKKVDDLDRDLNAELDDALKKSKPLPDHVLDEIQAAARRTVAKMRGGARPGAGRKPLGKIRIDTQLAPETLAYLTRAAGGRRGIGAVIDRLVAAAPKLAKTRRIATSKG